ncbi:MAG: hypothetical protein ACI7YS_05975 [Flavobacterium sp.]
MNSTSEKLQQIKEQGFHLDLDNVLKAAFENYKKIALFIGLLIFILILLFTIFIGSIATIAFSINDITMFMTNYDIYENSDLAKIFNFIVKVSGMAIIAPLTAGILKTIHNAQQNNPLKIKTVFSYYRSIYFKDLFISALIIAIVTNTIDPLLSILNDNEDNMSFLVLISIGLTIFNALAGTLTLFTIPLIIFGKLNAIEAIKGSFTIIFKKFWLILLLVIIAAFCSILLGLMAFCIGLFFTLPFFYSVQYIMYRDIMGIESEEDSYYC